MAAVQGFVLTFLLAAFAMALAVTLGVTPPDLGKSASQPTPGLAPAIEAGDTTALV